MEKSHSNRITTLSLFIALGFIGTVVITNPNTLHHLKSFSPVEFVVQDDSHSDMIGGEHPTYITVSGDKRQVFPREKPILFHIKNNFLATAAVSYSFLLADELGNEIDAEPTSSVKIIEPGESEEYKLVVPLGLEEGLYTFQVTAVGRSKEEFADSGVDLNFAILNDSIYLLSNEEWLKYSLANGANPQ
jgi:hypothetical protein